MRCCRWCTRRRSLHRRTQSAGALAASGTACVSARRAATWLRRRRRAHEMCGAALRYAACAEASRAPRMAVLVHLGQEDVLRRLWQQHVCVHAVAACAGANLAHRAIIDVLCIHAEPRPSHCDAWCSGRACARPVKRAGRVMEVKPRPPATLCSNSWSNIEKSLLFLC